MQICWGQSKFSHSRARYNVPFSPCFERTKKKKKKKKKKNNLNLKVWSYFNFDDEIKDLSVMGKHFCQFLFFTIFQNILSTSKIVELGFSQDQYSNSLNLTSDPNYTAKFLPLSLSQEFFLSLVWQHWNRWYINWAFF